MSQQFETIKEKEMTRSEITNNVRQEIKELESKTSYNRSRMFKRAHYLVRTSYMTLSEALKQVWKETKEYQSNLSEKIESAYNRLAERFAPMESNAMYNKAHNDFMLKVSSRNN